jgi:HEAT repeat protein
MMFFNEEKKKADKLIGDLLFEKNNRIFNQAKDELLKMGNIVIDPLIKAISLKTDFEITKKPIIELLGKLQDERVINTIIYLYKKVDSNGENLNLTISNAFTDIGKPAIESLINLLYDNDENIKCMAAAALGKIGDKRPVGELTSVLENDKSLQVKFSYF